MALYRAGLFTQRCDLLSFQVAIANCSVAYGQVKPVQAYLMQLLCFVLYYVTLFKWTTYVSCFGE